MYPFVENPNYLNEEKSDLDNCARLGLHIALYLEQMQTNGKGYWRGSNIRTSLRRTCQALEALYLLDLPSFRPCIEHGVQWLLNFAQQIVDEDEEETLNILLYPSRFKTLTWLRRINNRTSLDEFDRLCTNRISDEGLLLNDENQLLGSIIFADCAKSIADQGLVRREWQVKANAALNLIQEKLAQWVSQSQTNYLRFERLSDAVYGMDVLISAQRLDVADCHTQTLYQQMIQEISTVESEQILRSLDHLYYAVQIGTHFGQLPTAQAALDSFFVKVRGLYDSGEASKKAHDVRFHSLVLRAMLSRYPTELRDSIITMSVRQQKESLERTLEDHEMQQIRIFQSIIRERTHIKITERTQIAGGLTSAQVFRIKYELGAESILEHPEPNRSTWNLPSIIIKCDSQDALRHAWERYANLGSEIKVYFAKHAGEIKTFGEAASARAYLVLEDLNDQYRTLNALLDEFEREGDSASAQESIARVCSTISRTMSAIYNQTRHTKDEGIVNPYHRLYFGAAERYVSRILQSNKFPHFEHWVKRFWLAERKYKSLRHYLLHLDHYRSRFTVPFLSMVHGDLHSRNVMLDGNLESLKLIDLDRIDENGDYIMDFAKLLEDVAIFRYIGSSHISSETPPRDGQRLNTIDGQNGQSSLHFSSETRTRFDSLQSGWQAEKIRLESFGDFARNRIDYQPISSDVIIEFQRQLLQNIESYASTEGHFDKYWKERLWFALAIQLISVVNKQPNKQLATVLYVEAIKLLDQLLLHFMGKEPLAAIPFPGAHTTPTNVNPENPFAESSLPILKEIHQAILELEDELSLDIETRSKQSGESVRYFLEGNHLPFANIVANQSSTKLFLACQSDKLLDPEHLLIADRSSGAFQSQLPLNHLTSVSYVKELIRQLLAKNESQP